MVNQELGHTDSIAGLLRGILMDLRTLIREEIALARIEITEQAGRARGVAISFAVMGVALLFGTIFLLAAAATGLADLMNWPAWTVFLGLAVLLSGVGFLMLSSGRRQLHEITSSPVATVDTMKENAAWIAKRLSFGRK
jgi:hypothetical protein